MGLFSGHGRIAEGWKFDAHSQLLSPASVAQHKDGSVSIIFGTKDGRVVSLAEDGKERWTYQAGAALSATEQFFVDTERVQSISAPPTIADINLDGKPEILAGSEFGTLYCLSLDGKLLWKHECGGSIRASVLVSDINMDGKPEILVGSSNKKLTALTSDGKKLFEYMSDAAVESVPGVLKSSKSGKILIVFGNSSGILTAITPAQEVMWRVDLKEKITAAPAFYTDPEEERIVIGNLAGTVSCISEHGELVWQYKTLGSIYAQAAIADLNNDKVPEIVVGSCDNTVYALTSNGRKLWSYETQFWITGTPLVVDIDHDGHPEVIVGSYDHNIYVLDSQGSYVLDYVPGLSGIVNQAGHYSNILTSEPGEQTGKKLFQYRLPDMVVGCTVLEQLQGKPALVVMQKSAGVQVLVHER